MPNIRSQSLTSNGLTLVASDGRIVIITRADVIAHFQMTDFDFDDVQGLKSLAVRDG